MLPTIKQRESDISYPYFKYDFYQFMNPKLWEEKEKAGEINEALRKKLGRHLEEMNGLISTIGDPIRLAEQKKTQEENRITDMPHEQKRLDVVHEPSRDWDPDFGEVEILHPTLVKEPTAAEREEIIKKLNKESPNENEAKAFKTYEEKSIALFQKYVKIATENISTKNDITTLKVTYDAGIINKIYLPSTKLFALKNIYFTFYDGKLIVNLKRNKMETPILTKGLILLLFSNNVEKLEEWKEQGQINNADMIKFMNILSMFGRNTVTPKTNWVNSNIKETSGSGFKSKNIFTDTHSKKVNRLKVLVAERENGNNSPEVKHEILDRLKDLYYSKIITHDQYKKMYSELLK